MAANEIDIEKIFLIIRLRARLIGSILLASILLAAIITYQMPKIYQATASLNFDFSGSNPVDDRGRSILSEDSYLTTQVGILESLNVAQQVVNGLSDYQKEHLIAALDAGHSVLDSWSFALKHAIKSLFSGRDDEEPAISSEYAPIGEAGGDSRSSSLPSRSPYDWLAGALSNDLVINPLLNSRIVEVSYLSADPKVAALIADRFADAYIATNLQMVTDPARKSKVWFDEQLKSLRLRLEDAQAELTAYQQQEGIVSSDQRIDIESTNLSGLANQLVATQQEMRNAETEKQKLQEVLARGDSLETFEPVFSNSIVQKIKAEIRDLESQLVQSSNSLGANHPKIRKLKSELSTTKARLEAEIKTITNGIDNAADLAQERGRNLEAAMAKQKQLVLRLKSEHDKIVVLQRDVDSAQTAYNAALNQLNTTNLQSMVDQTNVSVVDHASIPTYHASPRITLNLALGAFGGLLLGVGIALFMEVFVRRVHSDEDLINDIGIPLLGHLRKY